MAITMLGSSGSSTPGLERECQEIHDSWGRLKLKQLVKSVACWSKLERQQIRETYKAIYGENISSLFQRVNASNGNDQPRVCEALSLWMMDPHERDAIWARQELSQQVETNYKALVEVFAGRKSSHVVLIKQAYQAKFRRILEQDILYLEPPHPYQKILVALATSHKAHHAEVSQHIAKCDARRLYAAWEGGSGNINEAVVLEILSKRSIPQMKLTISSYKHIYGHQYTKALKIGGLGEFEDALKTTVKCMCTPSYYAKELYTIINGTTADKSALFRVVMSRGEVDMDEIQSAFNKKYRKGLKDSICESIPSGDYRDFLVALATKNC